MSDQKNITLEQLEQLIQHAMQQRQNPMQSGPVPGGFGLMPQPMGMLQPMPTTPTVSLGAMPQPTGVSVPLSVPLPDGREVSIRVHFGAEAASNLPQLAMMCSQIFGPYLAARSPYRAYPSYRSNSRYDGWKR